MKWEFTPDEFIHIWGQIGADRYPAPLSLITSVRWRDEWETIENEIRQRIRVLDDPDLLPVLRTAANPETKLVLVGERKRPMRVYGAITRDIGITFVQRPGTTTEYGGNIVIEVGSPELVANVFAAVAGKCQAGVAGSMVEDYARLQDTNTNYRNSSADRMRNLLTAPRTGSGHVAVHRDLHEPRPAAPRYLSWFDVDGDGRYVYLRRYDDFHIDPCSQEALRGAISRLTQPT